MSKIHELGRQSDVGRWRSLTHSILINLFTSNNQRLADGGGDFFFFAHLVNKRFGGL